MRSRTSTPQLKSHRQRLLGLLAGLLLAAGLVLAARAPAQASPRWQRIASDKGIDVYALPDDKRDVPLFKGVTTIRAPILELLAILTDVDRACSWNLRCHTARTLQRTDDLHVIFYNRLDAPWPVDDRDAVYKAEARILDGGKQVRATFRAIKWPALPVPSGVVRFPHLIGTYRMDSLGPHATRVSYQIDASPGGMVPDWLVSYTSKRVPIATLSGLRRESRRIGKRYAAFVARHQPPAPRIATAAP